jgi:hypothetical protein
VMAASLLGWACSRARKLGLITSAASMSGGHAGGPGNAVLAAVAGRAARRRAERTMRAFAKRARTRAPRGQSPATFAGPRPSIPRATATLQPAARRSALRVGIAAPARRIHKALREMFPALPASSVLHARPPAAPCTQYPAPTPRPHRARRSNHNRTRLQSALSFR